MSLLLTFSLGACADEGPAELIAGNLVVHVHAQGAEQGALALIGGEIAVQAGCVVIGSDGSWYPVVWPHGTVILGEDPLVLSVPGGGRLELGQRVQGGGGFVPAGLLERDFDEGCLRDDGEVAVFNASERIVVGPAQLPDS